MGAKIVATAYAVALLVRHLGEPGRLVKTLRPSVYTDGVRKLLYVVEVPPTIENRYIYLNPEGEYGFQLGRPGFHGSTDFSGVYGEYSSVIYNKQRVYEVRGWLYNNPLIAGSIALTTDICISPVERLEGRKRRVISPDDVFIWEIQT